jgi:hypothetical protein
LSFHIYFALKTACQNKCHTNQSAWLDYKTGPSVSNARGFIQLAISTMLWKRLWGEMAYHLPIPPQKCRWKVKPTMVQIIQIANPINADSKAHLAMPLSSSSFPANTQNEMRPTGGIIKDMINSKYFTQPITPAPPRQNVLYFSNVGLPAQRKKYRLRVRGE